MGKIDKREREGDTKRNNVCVSVWVYARVCMCAWIM